MRRRPPARRGPGLVGTMARTAVVAGTATATVNAVNAKGAQKQAAAQAQHNVISDLQQQVDGLQAQQIQQAAAPVETPAPAPAEAAGAPANPLIEKLRQLSELHAAGVLTDEEFAQAKAKALA